ncbi:MAG: PilZ domain-containing protein [Nitrospirae bacterium]|nr:PilZ domain-containing protein [Nitrospirota bacterium]
MTPALEKRNASRVIKRLEVRFQTEVEHIGITSDLSKTGMFIRTNRAVVPGSVIKIKLHLPDAEEVSLFGKVVRAMKSMSGLFRTSKSGMGIHLIDPPQSYTSFVHSISN